MKIGKSICSLKVGYGLFVRAMMLARGMAHRTRDACCAARARGALPEQEAGGRDCRWARAAGTMATYSWDAETSVATVAINDGKMNAFGFDMISAVRARPALQ
jgi:hypothetical protein